MKVLLDTCILAELGKPNGNPAVNAALAEIPTPTVFLSVLSVGEIVKGIALLPPGGRRRTSPGGSPPWRADYGERILGLDIETARIWGELTARAQKKGVIIPPDRRPPRGDGPPARPARHDPEHEALRGERSPRPRPLAES